MLNRHRNTRRHTAAGRVTGWRLLALLATLGLVAAACGGGEEAPDGGASEGSSEVSLEPADGPVEIRVWASRDHSIPADEFAAFEEEHPNIDVIHDVIPSDDIMQQLQRMRDAGQKLPDVIQEDAFLMPAFTQLGLTRDLDDVLAKWEEEDPEGYGKVFPAVWEQGKIDDVSRHVPLASNMEFIYYNIPWFEEAGVEVPIESWDGLLEAARKLKETRPDQIPVSVQGKEGEGVKYLFATMQAMGVPFEGPIPQLTSEEGQYLMEWLLTMKDEGMLPPDAISWAQDESIGEFVAGRAGLIFDGVTAATDFNEVGDFNYESEWGTMLYPLSRTGDSEDGLPQTASRTWFISSETEHPYEASLVLRYYADTDVMVNMTIENGSPPPRQEEALAAPELAEHMPWFQDLKDAFLEGVPGDASPERPQVESTLEKMMGEIFLGTDETAEELGTRYQEELDAIVAE